MVVYGILGPVVVYGILGVHATGHAALCDAAACTMRRHAAREHNETAVHRARVGARPDGGAHDGGVAERECSSLPRKRLPGGAMPRAVRAALLWCCGVLRSARTILALCFTCLLVREVTDVVSRA